MQRFVLGTVFAMIGLFMVACGGGGSSGSDGYIVSGTVKDTAGDPIEDVTLAFTDERGDTVDIGVVKTDQNGQWQANGLHGDVTVTPIHDLYTFQPGSRNVAGTESDVDFVGTFLGPNLTVTNQFDTVDAGDSMWVMARINGADAGGVTIQWTIEHVGGGGNIGSLSSDTSTSGQFITWTTPTDTYGAFAITAEAIVDGESLSDTKTVDSAFRPLEVSIVADKETVEPRKQARLEAVVTGTHQSSATVTWSASEGTLSSTTGRNVRWTAPDQTGTFTVHVTTEAGSDTTTASLELNVGLCDTGDVQLASDPCIVTTVRQLQAMKDYLDGHFKLGGDIDATETINWNGGAGFIPIGTLGTNNGFRGTFDGDHYVITGLFIDRPDSEYVGLFGHTSADAVVQNVTLDMIDVTGIGHTGGVVGVHRGTLEHVYVDGGSVSSGSHRTGGIVGAAYDDGVIRHVANGADVTVTGSAVGGIAGWITEEVIVSDALNNGAIVGRSGAGGVVGDARGLIERASNVGSVSASSGSAGGIAGELAAGARIVHSFNLNPDFNVSEPGSVVAGGRSFDGAGGLVGEVSGTTTGTPPGIVQSYSITRHIDGGSAVAGGLVGTGSYVSIDESYSVVLSMDGSQVGGLLGSSSFDRFVTGSYWYAAGVNQSAGGTSVSPEALRDEMTFVGWDRTVWDFSNGYPDLVDNPRPSLNFEPLAVVVTADKTAVQAGEDVALNAAATGTLNWEANVTWSVRPDRGRFSSHEGNAVTWTAPSDSGGTFTVTAQAKVDGVVVTDSIPIDVDYDGLVLDLTADTDRTTLKQPVTLTAHVTGAGGQPVEVTWQSLGDGVLSDTTGPYVTWTAPDYTGNFTVQATAVAGSATDSRTLDIDVRLCDSGQETNEQNPCVITTVYQLQAMKDYPTGHFVLGDHIDAAETAQWNGGQGFEPIGPINRAFKGTLRGELHQITDLHIHRPGEERIGLFGRMDTGAVVSDLQLTRPSIVGGSSTGGVVGLLFDGTLENVHVVEGSVTGTGNVGGLAGNIHVVGNVLASSNSSTVSGSDQDVGGLAGLVGGYIIRSHNFGDVISQGDNVGGIAGRFWSGGSLPRVEGVSNVGAVTGGVRVGGIVGTVNDTSLVFAAMNTGDVTGEDVVGGVVGLLKGRVIQTYHFGDDVAGTSTAADGGVGGLAGVVDGGAGEGEILQSYSLAQHIVAAGEAPAGGLIGRLDGGTVDESYSVTDDVIGDGRAGGMIGMSEAGSVTKSYWHVTGWAPGGNSAGGTEKTDAEMQDASTFSNWDPAVWDFTGGYPEIVDLPRP